LLMPPPPPSPDPTRRRHRRPIPPPSVDSAIAQSQSRWSEDAAVVEAITVGSIVQVGPPSHKNRWPHVLHLLFHLSSHPISGESSSRR
jgi:hypothetical protein